MTADSATHTWFRRLLGVTAGALALAAVLAPAGAEAASAPYVPGVVVVGFGSHAAAGARNATLARAGMLRESAPEAGVRQVQLRPGVSVTSAIARLKHRRGVLWAVPDYIAHEAEDAPVAANPFAFDASQPFGGTLAAPFEPNDPGKVGTPGGWQQLQWNFAGPYGVGAPQAWANLIAAGRPGGEGVTVAVLDTGVAYAKHGRYIRSPDFSADEFVRGYDFVSHSPYPEDHNGHGTQVAGTIAEETNNGVGVTGLAYGVRLMPIRVLNSLGNGDATTIADGIIFAVKHHAQIINLSLEYSAGSVRARQIPQLIAAIDYAHSKNVLIVAAAGNEGVDELSYPAKANYVLSVGATTADGCLAFYSNYGTDLGIVAPGGGGDATIPGDPNCSATALGPDVYQETFTNVNFADPRVFGLPDGYFGTSMATPHVSATAALVIASGVLGPHPTVAAIIQRLESTATSLDVSGTDPQYFGAGLVNAAAATAPAGSTGTTGPTATTGTSGTSGTSGASGTTGST